MKKILVITLSLLLAFSGVAYGASKWGEYRGSQIIRLTVDGTPVKVTDVPAVSLNGRTMVPIYLLSQAGIKYTWDQANQTVNIVKPVEAPAKVTYTLTPYMLELISQSVYKILGSTDDPTKARQGSGFIYNGLMITNAHVSGDSAFTQVTVDGKVQNITRYKFVNKDTDLMGFSVEGGMSLPVSTELPRVGDVCYTISYPHGELKVTEGVVTGVKMLGGATRIYHNTPTDNGSSGSPLFSGKGEVIGVNRGSNDYLGEHSVEAIPVIYLMNELK